MTRTPIAAAVTLVLAAATAIGCGDDTQQPAPVILDTKRVERAIEQSILTERKVTADVDCPAGVRQAKGLTFRCVATTRGGVTAAFVVHQKDDKGNVTYAAP